MADCLFCNIAAGEIPSRKVFEDDDLVAFEDINPRAPVHVLVIPRRHVATLNDVTPADDLVLGRLVRAGARIARDRGVAAGGYRLVFNCNADAGQSVWHVHVHVLGGRSLSWPPG
jgi:histidine triad (HIT) family protein